MADETVSELKKYAVMPLTLSFDTLGGIADPIILRGTKLPVQRTREFTTAEDQQSQVLIRILCGESPVASKNASIHDLCLDELPAAARGDVKILVTLDVSATCQVSMRALVEDTGIEKRVVLTALEKFLTEDKIARIIERAAAEQEDDNHQLRLLEAKRNANLLISRAESRLATMMPNQRADVERAIAEVGLALQTNDAPTILDAANKLERLVPEYVLFSNSWLGDLLQQTRRPSSAAGAKRKVSASKQRPEMARSADLDESIGRVFGGRGYALDPGLCFVLMPFLDSLRPVYEDHIKPIVEAVGLRCVRADEIVGTAAITKDIWEHICRARVIVADLTGMNANVFYEIGLAHALGKDVILLSQSMDDVPFDLKMLRCIVYAYSPRTIKQMEAQLKQTIAKTIKSPSLS